MYPLRRFLIVSWLLMTFAMPSVAAQPQGQDQIPAANPLRLSYVNGDVSFWRYGAEDWVTARINTPLIAGDSLYAGKNAELELQGEGRAYIRADDETQITLINQTPDFLQLKITSGRISMDLRTLPAPGYTIEVDTPNAVFTTDHVGYYRVDVDGDVHFITRRGGQATMLPAGGSAMTILPSEEIVVAPSRDIARAETYVAPELDDWDRWNYDRTNDLTDAYSERYLPSGIAGTRDLDFYGTWRITDDYGPVWVPDALASDWAPYSTGRWVWDPYYQWTWIDDAPWGWAPFHYGRWVYLGGYWAWAPGPVVLRRPVYSPALVAFLGSRDSGLCWIALGWGEPLVPWWGHRGFIGHPWWGGWDGPRVVNNIRVRPTTAINITNITYVNSRVSHAIVSTPLEHFGRDHIHDTPDRSPLQQRDLDHIRGALPVKPSAANLVADAPSAQRPPEHMTSRAVVATRHPQQAKLPWNPLPTAPTGNEQHLVPAPKPAVTDLRRPEPGTQTGPERGRQPLPPRFEDWKRQTEPALPSPAVQERRTADRTIALPPTPGAAPVETISPPRNPETAPQDTARPPAAPTHRPPAPPEADSRPPSVKIVPPEPPMPLRNDRASGRPAPPAPQSQHMEAAPQKPRADLPGVPANRTYRDGNPARQPDRERQHH